MKRFHFSRLSSTRIYWSRSAWGAWPIAKRLEGGLSGYSDLAVGPDGAIYCFYEAASTGQSHYAAGRLVLARFNLEWLKARGSRE